MLAFSLDHSLSCFFFCFLSGKTANEEIPAIVWSQFEAMMKETSIFCPVISRTVVEATPHATLFGNPKYQRSLPARSPNRCERYLGDVTLHREIRRDPRRFEFKPFRGVNGCSRTAARGSTRHCHGIIQLRPTATEGTPSDADRMKIFLRCMPLNFLLCSSMTQTTDKNGDRMRNFRGSVPVINLRSSSQWRKGRMIN
ncbi:hypothetical protein DFH09DRAFT_1396327 [Mycena vulgaris]|nr:hypothetical protein DFH09DRAFT_1396327 [Mycena vulgaris]